MVALSLPAVMPRVMSPPSPFAIAAPRLLDMGYSVMPIIPGQKRPGLIEYGDWRGLRDWERFCDRAPTDIEMTTWCTYQGAGVCVALGEASGWLVAIDLDYGSPEVRAALEAILPPSPIRKAGAKGYTAFYRGSPAIRSRVYKVAGQSVCEVLSRGRQTVLPPTLHPEGMSYRWLTEDTLEDTDVADLPALPDDIADQIVAVLTPHGYQDRPPRTERSPGESRPAGTEGSIWSDVNAAALADLDAWVPELHLERCDRTRAGYRAVPHWRPSSSGRPVAKRSQNLLIASGGIHDFGEDRHYSPLDLVMAVFESSLDAAFAWLSDRVHPHAGPILLASTTPAAPVATDLPPHDPETGEIYDDPPDSTNLTPDVQSFIDADAELEELTYVPGLLGDMVDWIEGTARKPSRILALGVSLTALGAVMGRRYAGPTNVRTNLYIATLAGSAFGKGHPMKAIKALFEATGILDYLGGSKIRSDAGLRRAIEQKGSLLYLIDEVGGPLATWLGKTKSGHHLTAVRDMLLEFFSNADSIYQGDDYHEGQTPPVFNPNLCLYGTTTPEDFWRALQGSNVVDGFLPRFLVFPLNGKRPAEVEPRLPPEPPADLIERIRGVVMPARGGNLAGMVHVPGTAKLPAFPVPWGEGALDLWRHMAEEQDQAVDEASLAERGVLARRNEHAQKLALIRAVGQDPERPVIFVEDLYWGKVLADVSIKACLGEARDMIADNQYQADYLRVLKLIGNAGPRGLTTRELLKSLKGCIDKRRIEEILEMLGKAGEVEIDTSKVRGQPRTAYVRRPS